MRTPKFSAEQEAKLEHQENIIETHFTSKEKWAIVDATTKNDKFSNEEIDNFIKKIADFGATDEAMKEHFLCFFRKVKAFTIEEIVKKLETEKK